MAIYIQGKSGSCMSQILLNGLDIISGFDGSNGIGMAQIVKASSRGANLRDDNLKIPIYDLRTHMLPQLVRKHEAQYAFPEEQ